MHYYVDFQRARDLSYHHIAFSNLNSVAIEDFSYRRPDVPSAEVSFLKEVVEVYFSMEIFLPTVRDSGLDRGLTTRSETPIADALSECPSIWQTRCAEINPSFSVT